MNKFLNSVCSTKEIGMREKVIVYLGIKDEDAERRVAIGVARGLVILARMRDYGEKSITLCDLCARAAEGLDDEEKSEVADFFISSDIDHELINAMYEGISSGDYHLLLNFVNYSLNQTGFDPIREEEINV